MRKKCERKTKENLVSPCFYRMWNSSVSLKVSPTVSTVRAGTDLNSGTARILERTRRVGGSGRVRRCERSFAAACRIGWLISHSHDYIGEMENIYIRVRGEPRVSDWVRYSGNKKVRSTTEQRRTHSSFASSHKFSLSLHRFSSRQLVVPVPRRSPPNSLAKAYGYPGTYRRNAVVRRIEMFDHTRDWLILYLLAAFYFSQGQ